MGLPVVYLLAASREAIEAARHYERQRPGWGNVFFDEIARIERHVSDAPGLHQLVEARIRRATLRRFPFGLFNIWKNEIASSFWPVSTLGKILERSAS